MDFNEIREGAIVWLPVFHPGALLFVADGHVLMADGEPTGAGIETSMDVEFSVELRKQWAADGTARRHERLHHRGWQSGRVHQQRRSRCADGNRDMVRWLVDDYLEQWAAHMLIGAKGEYEIVTVMGSAALKIAKRWLPPSR